MQNPYGHSDFEDIASQLIEKIFELSEDEYCIQIYNKEIELLCNLSSDKDVFLVKQHMAEQICAVNNLITVYYLDNCLLVLNQQNINWHRLW